MIELICQACCDRPLDFRKLRQLLETQQYTPEELSRTAMWFVYEYCFGEAHAWYADHDEPPAEGSFSSMYLYGILELLLTFGLDPNLILDNDCLLNKLKLVDYEYTAANCMRLLLEHGGDPNLEVDGETVFEDIDFDVIMMNGELPYEHYDRIVHAWFVLLGYGGHLSDGREAVQMKSGHQVEELRLHEAYSFSVESTNAVKEGWILHIIRKETGEEVAVL